MGGLASTTMAAGSVLLSGLTYNRDGYAANVQMRQNQLYQDKNYHITWIAAVREEVRDIMTIFVGRMTNYMVVDTLILGIAASALQADLSEGTEGTPDFIAHHFYMNIVVSVMYLVMSMAFATKGITAAYSSGMDFLVKVVPDHMDQYNWNYMHQVTRNFEREGWREVFRVPLSGMFEEEGTKPRRYKYLERLPRGNRAFVTFTMVVSNLDIMALASNPVLLEEFQDVVRTVVMFQAGEEHVELELPQLQRSMAPRGSFSSNGAPRTFVRCTVILARGEGCEDVLARLSSGTSLSDAVAAGLGSVSALKGPVVVKVTGLPRVAMEDEAKIAAQESSSDAEDNSRVADADSGASIRPRCATSVASRTSYFESLKRYSALWEPFSLSTQTCLIHGVASLFQGSAYYCLGRLYDRSERWAGLTLLCLFVLLAMVLFSDGAVAYREDKEKPSTDVKVGAGAATLRRRSGFEVAASFALFAGPTACAVADKADRTWSAALFVPLSYFFHTVFFVLVLVQEVWLAERLRKAKLEVELNGVVGARLRTLSGNWQTCKSKTRIDPETNLKEFLERSSATIEKRRRWGVRMMGAGHIAASLSWLSMLSWSIVVHVPWTTLSSPAMHSESIPVEWPSRYFQPRALACNSGRVFIADDYRIFEVLLSRNDDKPRAVELWSCNLKQPIADIAASCDAGTSRCDVFALTRGEAVEIINCSNGKTLPLLQAAAPARLLARVNSTTIFAQLDGQVVEHRWVSARNGFQPVWSIAGAGPDVRAVDIVDAGDGRRDIFVFRAGHSGSGMLAVPSAVLEVGSLDSAGVDDSWKVWRFPERAREALRGGCGLAKGSSRTALALLQSSPKEGQSNQAPTLVKLQLS